MGPSVLFPSKVDRAPKQSSESEVRASTSTSTSSPKERERHSLCWNFPRVKLRQIFNAKSLDDILGRNQGPESSSRQQRKGQLPTSSSPHPHAHSRLKPGPGGVGVRPRSSSSQSHKPSDEVEESFKRPVVRLSSSSSDIKIEHRTFHYEYPLTPQVLSNSSSESNCYLSSSYIQVPPEGTGTVGTLAQVTKVTCAKSDNCINRVVTALPTASIIRHTIQPPHNSPSELPGGVLLSRPIPTIVRHSPEGPKTRKKIHFSSNRVEPSMAAGKQSGGGGDGPKLVVASLSYLQRPASPSCTSPSPSPLGLTLSDPSGSGMRTPVAGFRTPQALLSPTAAAAALALPISSVFQIPIPTPTGGDQSTRTSSSSRKCSPSPRSFFSSCCRSSQSIPTEEEAKKGGNGNGEYFRENAQPPQSGNNRTQPIVSRDAERKARNQNPQRG